MLRHIRSAILGILFSGSLMALAYLGWEITGVIALGAVSVITGLIATIWWKPTTSVYLYRGDNVHDLSSSIRVIGFSMIVTMLLLGNALVLQATNPITITMPTIPASVVTSVLVSLGVVLLFALIIKSKRKTQQTAQNSTEAQPEDHRRPSRY